MSSDDVNQIPQEVCDHYQVPGRSPQGCQKDVAVIDSRGNEPPVYVGEGRPRNGPIVRPRLRHGPWTIQEHKGFLRGVEEFGMGDWRTISKYSVNSRTPVEVALHARKFKLRKG